jgi:hypothetical protein
MSAQTIGPGPHPDLRDEPVAFAIWQALLGVRDAWGWADVARQVEAELRRRGLAGDVHDRLRKAERERDAALIERNTAVAQLRAHHAREARRG